MTTILDQRHDELLSAIEDRELLSLAWGDVEGSLSPDEATELAQPKFGARAEDAVEALIDAGLLYTFNMPGGGERYRSRFAETVRLLARARQIFMDEEWQGAPPLVADFRVDLRSRRYPRQDQPNAEAISKLGPLGDLQRAIWRQVAPSNLAAFQVRATQTLLIPNDTDRGVIVTAGTGAGKTLAFYLPVFMQLAPLVRAGEFWTKAIAIYPRSELLKDQLTEAYRNAGRCAEVLTSTRGRPFRLASFYKDTPYDVSAGALDDTWAKRGQDWLCPFLRCDCGDEMIWKRADVEARREILTCVACGSVSDERLVLTRLTALRAPPDILFTTTEMINRSLSDPRRWPLFGVCRSKDRRPNFLLLDEAHTYTGVSGAQAALTFRRWRAMHGGPLAWIGLSATLAEAPRFFAELTGLELHRVLEVTPDSDEMKDEGREYQVALRGDPASGASLLSTSIQALMLLGRVMDNASARSEGRSGRRVFAFTDDLDVTHRLFDDLSDAEAYNPFGRPDAGRQPLAIMRAQTLQNVPEGDAERRQRDFDGQRWRLPEVTGRTLGDRLVLGRTTSRDPGVSGRADVIVATSALEVGFNDPTVGAVLQHKAPRNFASFLQRRGRAGRDRRMRPLTVTVLSDYGRDRELFQSFEHLFEPVLAPQTLPVGNQYVLRMQGAYALLDWVALQPRPPGLNARGVWATAAQPRDRRGDAARQARAAAWQTHVRDTVALLVRGETSAIASFRAHLRGALGVDGDVVDRILWTPPRSLLLEVAPTLGRRLFRDWERAWPQPENPLDRWFTDHPLPDFVPRALFADLNLPEVEIVLPRATQADVETTERMPIQRALSQFTPGRVSRRFGDVYGGLAHWFAVPPGVSEWRVPVATYAESLQFLGDFAGSGPAGAVTRTVYRPWRIRLEKAVHYVVKPTSNARLDWASGFVPAGIPVEIDAPLRTAWRGLVTRVELYLHQYRASVSVRRFALGARAEIKRAAGVEQLVDVTFVDATDAPVGLGFEFETDGLAFHLRLPTIEQVVERRFEPAIDRGLSKAYLKRIIHDDAELPRDLNGFQRAWLRQIYTLAAARRALDRGSSLAEASAQLINAGNLSVYDEIMDGVLGLSQALGDAPDSDDDADGDGDGDGATTGSIRRGNRLDRLRNGLRARLADSATTGRLAEGLGMALTRDARWGLFVRRTAENTLAEALLAAVTAAAPRHASTDALIVDVDRETNHPDDVVVWLTETTVSGAGVLQSLAVPFAEEPRMLFRALEAALEPSDLEMASAGLAQTYRLCGEDPEISRMVERVRAQEGHVERFEARAALIQRLQGHGVEIGRAFVVSMNARLLGRAMRREHDELIRALLSFWERAERDLGLEFEPREIAVLAAFDAGIEALATRAGLTRVGRSHGALAKALAPLLWSRTSALLRDNLASYNPYAAPGSSDPALLRALLLQREETLVDLEAPNGMDALLERLALSGSAQGYVSTNRADILRSALIGLPATPIAMGHLTLYATLERVSRDAHRLIATFVLKEQL